MRQVKILNRFYNHEFHDKIARLNATKSLFVGGVHMSIASATAFLEKMKEDAAFKTKVLSLPSTGDERKKFVMGSGFDFTFAELQQASSTVTLKKDDEISPEDLDQIAAACIGMATVTVAAATGGAVVGTIVSDSVS